jgi:hypothetical protein
MLKDIKKNRKQKEKIKNISIRMNDELFKKFKRKCRINKVTMKETMEYFISNFLK